MNDIFKQLFQYGFHDTELSSICGDDLKISLIFDKGIYLLDKTGKETILSEPIQIILKINSYFDSFEDVIEIREYGKKVKYLNYSTMKKYLLKDSFGISMAYFSNFNNCIMFDGGISKRNIMLSIEGIEEIVIQENKKV
ncbi:MAG: hypothetical protein IKW53_04610 [Clostridia bacterium]|nr:hypothetical protein [Clostridia bacterium]